MLAMLLAIMAAPDPMQDWANCIYREARAMAAYPEPISELADAVVASCGREETAFLADLERQIRSYSAPEIMAMRREFREDARRKALLALVEARHRPSP